MPETVEELIKKWGEEHRLDTSSVRPVDVQQLVESVAMMGGGVKLVDAVDVTCLLRLAATHVINHVWKDPSTEYVDLLYPLFLQHVTTGTLPRDGESQLA